MTEARPVTDGGKIIVMAPTGKDAALTVALLSDANIDATVCRDADGLDQIADEAAGCLLVAEEAITNGRFDRLVEALARQPPWSDVPVLLLTRYGADSALVKRAGDLLSNVTLLERPLRPTTLLSAVRAALRARDRQYQVRDYLAEQVRTQAALREADRRKDEFLATLAHELRNPLAPIRNALSILQFSGSDAAVDPEVYTMMERQVGNLVRLVDDLMEVSRITRGKVELRVEPVELAVVIRNAVEAARPLIDRSKHELEVLLPEEPLVVRGDPVRLAQVFTNLLNNAAKYMHEGGRIRIQARRQADEVVVSVCDTGIGIPADMLPQIFNMFTQVDGSARRAQGGLGIGLTLVRSLVEMHGGWVTAESAGLDCGSKFIVGLPLAAPAAPPERFIREPGAAKIPPCRVLVVDDNRDSAGSLGRLLTLLGAEVRVAHDGPAALAALEKHRPRAVVLDLGMPGMDGYEVARRIRREPAGADILLIALTGWGQDEDRQRTRAAGFDHHLLKPADLTTLRSLLLSLAPSA